MIDQLITWDDVTATIEQAVTSALRLELQPAYPRDAQFGALNSWLAGGPANAPTDEPDLWLHMVTDMTTRGVDIMRIRVIDNPLTPYQQWLYPACRENVDAGEQIFHVGRATAASVGVVSSTTDWWLVDGATLIVFGHEPDPADPTITLTTDPARIGLALVAWHSLQGVCTNPYQ